MPAPPFAYGRWGERREIYGSDLFATGDSDAMRDVHMGVDVFCEPGEPVYSPLSGRVVIKVEQRAGAGLRTDADS